MTAHAPLHGLVSLTRLNLKCWAIVRRPLCGLFGQAGRNSKVAHEDGRVQAALIHRNGDGGRTRLARRKVLLARNT